MPGNQRRLFFALWPDNEIRQGIVQRREALGAAGRRRVPDHNLHLTLLFLGNQPAERVAGIEAAVDDVSAETFRLRLDRFGWFARARVVWLGGEAPAAAQALVADLARVLQPQGLNFDVRPFRPHITLFRKVTRRPDLPDPEPLEWPIREFALIESIPGSPYRVLREWPLTR